MACPREQPLVQEVRARASARTDQVVPAVRDRCELGVRDQ